MELCYMINMNEFLHKINKFDIYKKNGRDCYLDPIRKKLTYKTPEETVRQKMILFLLENMNIPSEMILVEEKLSHFGVEGDKGDGRADIVICQYKENENTIFPIAIIECKAPEVILDEQAVNQGYSYADSLNCDYVMITNGEYAYMYKYIHDNKEYVEIKEIPKYNDMLNGIYEEYVYEEFTRCHFNKLSTRASDYIGNEIGESTQEKYIAPLTNFIECLYDEKHKLSAKKYTLFNVCEDYGLRLLSYGNASGGVFTGVYRSFLIEYNGNNEFINIGLASYCTYAKPDVLKTSINVGIDTENGCHHSIQLVVDNGCLYYDNHFKFFHSGRIGISNKGSGKIADLKLFIRKMYSKILVNDKIFLGTLTNDHLWYLNEKDMEQFIENLISYALIRDEYRKYFLDKV